MEFGIAILLFKYSSVSLSWNSSEFLSEHQIHIPIGYFSMDALDFNAFRPLHNVLQNYQIVALEPNLLDNALSDHVTTFTVH